jgi:hypothetical protein
LEAAIRPHDFDFATSAFHAALRDYLKNNPAAHAPEAQLTALIPAILRGAI